MKASQPQKPQLLYPPGGILIWLIIAVELLTFAGAFLFFFIEKSAQPDIFSASQKLLNRDLATANTVVLIVSGYFAAAAVLLFKARERSKCVGRFLIAAGLGLVFVGLKGVEYYDKIALGKTLGTNTFFDFYWMLTGFHLAHVLVGIMLLMGVSWQVKNPKDGDETEANVETVASFWHLCDLIWVFLFPVVYLV